jgi:hypothetical protein
MSPSGSSSSSASVIVSICFDRLVVIKSLKRTRVLCLDIWVYSHQFNCTESSWPIWTATQS